ncbi:family 16 glycosylhydrolase [bacterium SCSIO 12741]|nr:family 16 glycosylhydrolase [bacterium SCSIO 12741]
MIKFQLTVILGLTFLVSNAQLDASWKVTWQDDFNNQNSLNSQLWHTNYDWRQGYKCYEKEGSHYFQAYRSWPTDPHGNYVFDPQAVTGSPGGGKMELIVKQKTLTHPNTLNACVDPPRYETRTTNYTAPMWVVSQQAFKYGYFEIRFKLPALPPGKTNEGIGANFWLFGDINNISLNPNQDIVWSELDIFEFLHNWQVPPGPGQNHNFSSGVHYTTIIPNTTDTVIDSTEGTMPYIHVDFDGTYKTMGCLWLPDRMAIYLDGEVVYHNEFPYLNKLMPMSIILDHNVAVSGSNLNPNTLIDYTYDIDYVKVYQLEMDCTTDFAVCEFNPVTYNNNVKKSISVGGYNCDARIPGNFNISFRAADFVELKEGFEVELGAEFYADITDCNEAHEIR